MFYALVVDKDMEALLHSKNLIWKATILYFTRKYPLRGYILGVLTHTTALDWLWGGDVFLKIAYT